MWLPRPFYESLPYVCMAVGLALLGAAWVIEIEAFPSLFMVAGALTLTAGLVLWLRRRDYRTRQAQYNNRSLDE
ncbi:MAG TPA: hypothetical protein VHK24_08205 [Steroidobacter sp.]|jgi:hypothetical protein|nr:hypothetical protein [Steroidobacter sp.]